MAKVLLMGGTYFIGRKIAGVLLDEGYDVTVLNRGTKSSDSRAGVIICDRNNPEEMKKALAGRKFDIVVDVSGVNALQMQILYGALDKNALTDFIFISSSSVYDVDNLTVPFRVGDALGRNIWGDYGTDKIKAEEYLCREFSNGNTRLTVLRPPYVYGENNYAQRESFIFNHVINDRPVIIPSSNPVLQFIYTGDLAHTISALISLKKSGINIYNVGNKKSVTSREWVNACADVTGKKAQIIEYDYKKDNRFIRDFFPFYDYDNVLDTVPIHCIYNKETDFRQGLEKAYKWFLENRQNIMFKQNVTDNESAILNTLT